MNPDEIIRILGLSPHPEGGAFCETYRSAIEAKVDPTRSVCTAIYFLLREGQPTSWHSVLHDEIYHFYAGYPLELSIIDLKGDFQRVVLGTDLESGQRPQILIPGTFWQSARTLGAFTLIGCTVSPGFDFNDFKLASIEELTMQFPRIFHQLNP
ncbi:MAG: cupin domain-containing protein [Bacteroidetes bacterium]|nr:cupin domain-containing protein [Bacteroidota bacterium]